MKTLSKRTLSKKAFSLTSEQRQQIEDHLARLESAPNERQRRRLLALLLYDTGKTTLEVAAATGLSRGRVRYWRRRFNERGMDLFPLVMAQKSPEGEAAEAGARVEPVEHTGEQPLSVTGADSEATAGIPVEPQLPAAAPGSALSAPSFPAPLARPGVSREDSMAEAGRKVMLFHFAEMLSHEEGTRLGEDIEELHDMRVATRRLRAAFDLFAGAFEPKTIKRHLKGLRAAGRALGRVRDLDVFIEKAQHYLDVLPPEQQSDLEPLVATWTEERAAARTAMLAHLDSPEYRDFKGKFNTFVQTPGKGVLPAGDAPGPGRVLEAAPVLIYTRLAAVRAYGPLLGTASLVQLHALRIEFKKLRYAVEFFREVLGEEAKAVIQALKGVQDHLGDLNDANVAAGLLSQFLSNWEQGQVSLLLAERQSPAGIASYLAAKHTELHRLMVTFPETWVDFEGEAFRRSLALAVAAL